MAKYGNKKTIVDNIVFDSKIEAVRYQELKLLQAAGEIFDLELQPKFELISELQEERPHTYTADFLYRAKPQKIIDKRFSDGFYMSNGIVVEDVKSDATRRARDYIINRKLFKEKYPWIVFREIVR